MRRTKPLIVTADTAEESDEDDARDIQETA
jgi:hypothetical protein